jgi:hypothetical protein
VMLADPLDGLHGGPADQGAALFICGGGERQARRDPMGIFDVLRPALGCAEFGLGSRLGRSSTAQRPSGP